MAEKGFGVKEVNLIGASGTPTITSPNNLNLNANNVAISTNVSIGGTLSVTGNVSVGGTLTYEDVTNIDSVGLITARTGVKLPDSQSLTLGTDDDAELKHTGSNLVIRNTTGNIRIEPKNGQLAIQSQSDERTSIYFSGSKKFETTNTGVVVTGILTATTFSGSGASLTSLPAANLTGTLPAISGANLTNLPAATPTNSDIQVVYTVTANGASAYRFAGNGVVSTADNPDLYFIRGQKYRFINNSGGSHPFQIREASGGTAYSTGVTNNGAASGNIDFAPTYDSPAQLVYQCTAHGGMVGNIYLRDAAGNNTNVGVTTFANITANNINGNTDINVGTGEVDIYSTGSGDQLSLRLLNSDASAGNKIGIYFGPANNVAGAFIKGHAESDFTTAANRDAGLIFGTRLDANFLESMKISASGTITTPYQFHIEVRRSGNQTGYDARSSAAGTPVVFNDVVRTRGTSNSALNTSTGKITVPVDGVYFLEASVYTTAGNALSQGWFTEGSSRMTYSDITEDENTDQVQAHGMHYLSANTEVGFHPYGATASSITIEANVYHTWFRVTLIG